ncbi:MAG: transposase [Deltaproteobacteria bacterium]|nr:transposase [Deltaproteobacteria bacterium]
MVHKNMPRQARLDAPGTLHHIIARTIDGVLLFRNRKDREIFLSRLPPLLKTTGAKILAWALMDTHFHLLMLSGEQKISKLMRCLLTGYALYYNRKYHRRGHLFQNRFKSIVCEREPYLLELVRYIHLNPWRAGKVRSLAELDSHPWSGHGFLIGKMKNDWQERDFVLNQFSPDAKKAIQIYHRFLGEGKHQGRREDLSGGGLIRSYGGWSRVISLRGKSGRLEHDPRILGKAEYVEEILQEASQEMKRQFKTDEREKLISQTINLFCRQEAINELELRQGGQRKPVSRARAQIAFKLNRSLGIPLAEIARVTGVSAPAITKAIKKFEVSK